jgi:signal transduction histidine kinase
MEEIDRFVHKAIDITRNLTVEINPPVLKHEGLTEALRWLRSHMKKSFDLDVEIKGECAIRDEDTRALLFQLVRELLFNIVKHAGVSKAQVEIGEQNGQCVVRVTDEGKGFDPQPLTSKDQAHRRLGLTSASERVELFGGRLEIDSAPGRGASVTILVPV